MKFLLPLLYLILIPVLSLFPKEMEGVVIRVGSFSKTPPYMIPYENGTGFYGIENDIISLLQKKMDTRIELVQGTREELLTDFNKGYISALLVQSEEFELPGRYLKSDKILDLPLAVFSQDHSIYQLRINQFPSSRIGISQQSDEARIYMKSLNIPYQSFPDTDRGLYRLSRGEIDFFLDDLFYTKYLADNQNLKLSIKGIIENEKSHYFLIFPPESTVLRSQFNFAINQIKKDESYSIRNRWIGLYPNQKFDHMEFSSKEISWMEENPEILYKGESSLGPILFEQNNNYVGIVADILKIITEQTSIRFTPINDNKFPDFQAGNPAFENVILPIASLDNTDLVNYHFSDPYLTIPNVIFARKNDRIYIDNIYEMTNRKIILVKGMSVNRHMLNKYPEMDFIQVNTVREALRALIQSKADFYVGDMITGSYYMNKAGYNQLSMVGEIRYDMELRIAVPDTMSTLVPILNRALKQISPGENTSIIQKWTSLKLEDSINYSLLGQILIVFTVIILVILIWNRKLKLEIQERERSEEALRYSEHKSREAEEVSRIAREKAERLAVMAEDASKAKSQFLANMSHEIRTPLNSIIGFSELLETTKTSPIQEQYLDSVKTSAEVLLVLINDVLDLSKIEAGKTIINTAPVKLLKVFNDMKVIFSQRAETKGLNFRFVETEELEYDFLLDMLRIEQVLMNLIGNSLKFTESGFISVSARFKQLDNSDNYNITLIVADSGIGIKEDQRDKIFHLFEQSDNQDTRKFGGTGLGLGISNKLVELMNGSIHVDSLYGKGSVFSVNLPKVPCVGRTMPAGETSDSLSLSLDSSLGDMDNRKLITDRDLISRWIRVRDSGDPEAIKNYCHKLLLLPEVRELPAAVNTMQSMIKAAEEYNLDRLLFLSNQMNCYFAEV